MSDVGNGRLVVHLVVPGVALTRAHVRSGDECGVLAGMIPGRVRSFVWQGEILNPSRQFGSYGIQNSDSIFAIHEADNEADSLARQSRWVRLSCDNEPLDSRVRFLLDSSTQVEALRLRDLAWLRREIPSGRRSPRSPTRVFDGRRNPHKVAETVVPPSPAEISTARLPNPW
jgi:hypothetical protein